MEIVNTNRIPGFDSKVFWGKAAKESDCQNLVTADTIVYVDGLPQILYMKLDCDLKNLLWACQTIPYGTAHRTGGMLSTSATFGFMPRRALLRDFCNNSVASQKDPRVAIIFEDFAQNLELIYRQHFPDVFEAHQKIANERIRPEWKMRDSIFSSGISNKDNPLPYHKDAGNFKGVYSNMVGLKKGRQGGALIVPEIDLKFEIADGSLLIFNGQDFLHGVSPIIKTQKDSYRFTVVYYTLEQMWKCLPLKEEVKRIRAVKAKREIKRLELIAGQSK